MSTIFSTILTVISYVGQMIGDWLEIIFADGNELVALCTLLPLVGVGIGFLKRLLRVRA